MNETHHLRRMTTIWVILSIAADLLGWFVLGPHMPPGRMTETAYHDQIDFNILLMVALPVVIGVWVYMGYAITVWSAKRAPDPVGGDAARGNTRTQVLWISITSVMTLAAAAFGTWALVVDHGSGGGEGPNPIWAPSGAAQAETAAFSPNSGWTPGQALPVQVIGQQWKFTYRYPTFGGFETSQLILPDNATIVFNVTSLDVIHSFWAYQLGVKADANPQVNDVAYTETKQLGSFMVRCSELCGIWHGAMYNSGQVVTPAAFQSWAQQTEAANAANTKLLPPFAWTYVPDANGANGGYYPDGKATPYSSVEVYGSKNPAS